jgi:riboflavin biosynthesis pyrimidine reductase
VTGDELTTTAAEGWFELLLDEADDTGPGLPPSLRAVYGGDWRLPAAPPPYVYVNFVVAHDGRVSFNEPGHMGGGSVSRFDRRDQWLMGLLRSRADAVLFGEGTLRAEPEHVWTSDAIFPDDAHAFGLLRQAEGRSRQPLQVVLSLAGELPQEAALLRRNDLDVLIVTTQRGAERIPRRSHVDVHVLRADEADLRELIQELAERFGLRTLLCEGGPHVYGALLSSGAACDEFLTLSPLVVGEPAEGPPRPSLVEGAAFVPDEAPRPRLLSVRRGGDYLYLRSRYPVG